MKKSSLFLLILVVSAGITYWQWSWIIVQPFHVIFFISSCMLAGRLITLGILKRKSSSSSSSEQEIPFTLPPWFLIPLARIWGVAVKIGFAVLLIWLASFAWNHTSVATASAESSDGLTHTGKLDDEGFEKCFLTVTHNDKDCQIDLPQGAWTKFSPSYRVVRHYPFKGDTDVVYTADEEERGFSNPQYKDNYRNTFSVALDPSVTSVQQATMIIWVKDKGGCP